MRGEVGASNSHGQTCSNQAVRQNVDLKRRGFTPDNPPSDDERGHRYPVSFDRQIEMCSRDDLSIEFSLRNLDDLEQAHSRSRRREVDTDLDSPIKTGRGKAMN